MNDAGFVLYTRKLADGRLDYYAKFKNSSGKWGSGVRTGKTNEAAATRWAQEQIAEGVVSTPRGRIPTLDAWANGFFGVGGRYDTSRKARGYALSAAYLNGLGQRYKKYASPGFGHRKISEITAMDLDEFLLGLYNSELSGSSVNGVLKAVRALFGEAERLDVIIRDPSKKAKRFAEHNRKRGTLSQDELNKLFAIDALGRVWNDEKVPYLLCMSAVGCGLRLGEAIALRACDFRDRVVLIERQYDRVALCFKPPKWGSIREMPVPERLISEVGQLATESGYDPESLLFPSSRSNKPIDVHNVLSALRDALAKIGISKEEQGRDSRFIDFHSLRRTFVTRLRVQGVADWELQAAAGHKSVGMTDHYTHVKGKELLGVQKTKILPFDKVS